MRAGKEKRDGEVEKGFESGYRFRIQTAIGGLKKEGGGDCRALRINFLRNQT